MQRNHRPRQTAISLAVILSIATAPAYAQVTTNPAGSTLTATGAGNAVVPVADGTTATVNNAGNITGLAGADGIDVAGTGSLTLNQTGTADIAGSGGGLAVNVGPGASAAITLGGSSSLQGDGATVVRTGATTTIAMGAGTQISNTGSTGSAIVVPTGSTATVTATGLSAGALTIISGGSTSAAVIDVAGSASLNLDALVESSAANGAGPVITIEPTGNVPTLNATGFIAGEVTNLSTHDLTIVGNPNYTDGATGGMGQMGVLTGGVAGQGTINNENSNLAIGAGFTTLDDTVNLGTTVPHTLTVLAGAALVAFESATVNGNVVLANGSTFISQVQAGTTPTGTNTDSTYGRLIVNGNATALAGSTVSLRPYTAYPFVTGQRFDLISASGAGSTYNTAGMTATAAGYGGTVTASTIVQNGRTDLVAVLSDTPPVTPPSNPGNPSGPSNPSTPSDPTNPTNPTNPSNPSNPTSPSTPSNPTTPATAPVIATAPAARAALTGLMNYTGWSPALLNTFNAADAIDGAGTVGQANRAGVQLAPTPHSAALDAVRSMSDGVTDAIAGRSESTRDDARQTWTVWGQGVGGAAQQSARAGVDGNNVGYGGLVVGADRAVGERWHVGGAVGYTAGTVDGTGLAGGEHMSVSSLGVNGYASYEGNPWYVNASLGVSENEFSENCSVAFPGVNATASGHYHGEAVTANLEAGLPLALAHGFTVTPFAGLSALYLNQHGYSESDGQGVALNVNGASTTDVRSTMGVKIEKAFETKAGTIVPVLRLAYVHDFNGSAPSTTANFVGAGETTFTTAGLAQPANLADVGLGVTVYRARGLSLSANADLQIGAGYKSESVMIQARKAF
ncbi:autotransporter outer membrane beta-barrel domain-containing protein [Paraburkholderia dilworthii]|uniref:Autotransporter domain-containing protein n=1 Tax=Paraburkholderia dilworthii TaxID=948106 RepID=A0ABW9D6N4_9BURK